MEVFTTDGNSAAAIVERALDASVPTRRVFGDAVSNERETTSIAPVAILHKTRLVLRAHPGVVGYPRDQWQRYPAAARGTGRCGGGTASYGPGRKPAAGALWIQGFPRRRPTGGFAAVGGSSTQDRCPCPRRPDRRPSCSPGVQGSPRRPRLRPRVETRRFRPTVPAGQAATGRSRNQMESTAKPAPAPPRSSCRSRGPAVMAARSGARGSSCCCPSQAAILCPRG